MKDLYFDLFPNGKKKACVLSFDDNKIFDEKMTEILDGYGAKCTFNVNSSSVGKEGHIDKDFLRELSKTHEIASHTVSHLFLERNPRYIIEGEIKDDKKALEDIIGKSVKGFAYPFGTFNKTVIDVLNESGFLYARTVDDTNSFSYPEDYLKWHPTCHQSKAIKNGVIDKFLSSPWPLESMIVWGHSKEFDGCWQNLYDILDKLKLSNDVWYCTASELFEYKTALDDLTVSSDGKKIINNHDVSIFAHGANGIVTIKKGENDIL